MFFFLYAENKVYTHWMNYPSQYMAGWLKKKKITETLDIRTLLALIEKLNARQTV